MINIFSPDFNVIKLLIYVFSIFLKYVSTSTLFYELEIENTMPTLWAEKQHVRLIEHKEKKKMKLK